jgi:hypothetical protein
MRLYHGTSRDNAMMIQSNGFAESPDGLLGRGIYLTSSYDKVGRGSPSL